MTVEILIGDAREVMPRKAPFDMIIADPPYGDTSLAWDKRVHGWHSIARSCISPAGSMWVFGSLRYFLAEHEKFEAAGWRIAQEIVWEKHNGSGFHADRFKRVHEFAVHYYPDSTPWADIYNDVQTTADAHTDDATIRKLRGFADRNAWGHLIVGNLFAWRAKDVRELGRVSDPVGPDNDAHLTDIMLSAQQLIVAWGPISKQPKYHRARWRRFMELVRLARCQPLCIGEPAKCGHPKHPLMLGYDSPIIPWKEPTP